MKKLRHVLAATAATAALIVAGAGSATAQSAHPFTGSTGCTSNAYVHQYTTYHGTICYTNPGYDNLTTSGFWTIALSSGANFIRFRACDTAGHCATYPDDNPNHYYIPGVTYPFDDWPSGVGSLTGLWIA